MGTSRNKVAKRKRSHTGGKKKNLIKAKILLAQRLAQQLAQDSTHDDAVHSVPDDRPAHKNSSSSKVYSALNLVHDVNADLVRSRLARLHPARRGEEDDDDDYRRSDDEVLEATTLGGGGGAAGKKRRNSGENLHLPSTSTREQKKPKPVIEWVSLPPPAPKERKSRMNDHDRKYIERLLARHGPDGLQAMFNDIELNDEQRTVSQLKKMMQVHRALACEL